MVKKIIIKVINNYGCEILYVQCPINTKCSLYCFIVVITIFKKRLSRSTIFFLNFGGLFQQLIENKTAIEMKQLDVTVFTDSKWVQFILV